MSHLGLEATVSPVPSAGKRASAKPELVLTEFALDNPLLIRKSPGLLKHGDYMTHDFGWTTFLSI